MTRKPVHSIVEAIGNTPLVPLNKVVPPNAGDAFVKLEYYNPTGSYKDRTALSMVEEAEKRWQGSSGRAKRWLPSLSIAD